MRVPRQLEMGFVWGVFTPGYTWVETTASNGDGTQAQPYLTTQQPKTAGIAKHREYRPLAEHPGLFRTFAEVTPTAEGIKAFADRYGQLLRLGEQIEIALPKLQKAGRAHVVRTRYGAPGHEQEAVWQVTTGFGERLRLWEREIRDMAFVVALWEAVRQEDLHRLEQWIVWRGDAVAFSPPDGRPEPLVLQNVDLTSRCEPGEVVLPALFVIRQYVNERIEQYTSSLLLWDPTERARLRWNISPKNLLGGLWQQLALAIDSGQEYRACQHCGTYFELSPKKNRVDRVYCSDSCRSLAYRARRVST